MNKGISNRQKRVTAYHKPAGPHEAPGGLGKRGLYLADWSNVGTTGAVIERDPDPRRRPDGPGGFEYREGQQL